MKMKYQAGPKYKEYVEDYGFYGFQENLEINMVKN